MFAGKLIYHKSLAIKLGDTKAAPNIYWTILKVLVNVSKIL